METLKERIKMMECCENPCQNTDKELWRERVGDYYADSIHVTKGNGIGINCGGHVIVAPVKEWHTAGELIFCVNDRLPFFSIRRKLAMWLLGNKKRKMKLWNR